MRARVMDANVTRCALWCSVPGSSGKEFMQWMILAFDFASDFSVEAKNSPMVVNTESSELYDIGLIFLAFSAHAQCYDLTFDAALVAIQEELIYACGFCWCKSLLGTQILFWKVKAVRTR